MKLGLESGEKIIGGRSDVRFVIYDKRRYSLSYVKQDNKEHTTDLLVLPPNSEVPVFVWIQPKFSFTLTEYYFGCGGKLESKPYPIKYFNPFIKKGRWRELIPDRDDQVYINHHLYFHRVRERRFTRGERYVMGFILKTREEGRYPTQLTLVTRNKPRSKKLEIIVERTPAIKSRCLYHKNCKITYNF